MKTSDAGNKMTSSLMMLALSFLLTIPTCVHAQPGNHAHVEKTDGYAAEIDRLIQATSPRSFNGVILITKNGKTTYSKALGMRMWKTKYHCGWRIISGSCRIASRLRPC